MRITEVKYQQSLADVAIQHYGDVMGVYWLVEDNNLRSVVDVIEHGKKLIIREQYLNKRVAEELKLKDVATMDTPCEPVGIGFEQVGVLKII